MRDLGYAVAVWSQASRTPQLVEGSLAPDIEAARMIAADALARTEAAGRGETYSVVKVTVVEEVSQ